MKSKLLAICVLLFAAVGTLAQNIIVKSDQGTVSCSPRYAHLIPRTSPYAAYFSVSVSTATTLNRLKVTLGTKTQFSPFPGAVLIIDQKMYSTAVISGVGNTYSATFADFQAPLAAGGHIVEVDLINEVNAYRIADSFGTRVNFTINDPGDMGFAEGTFLTPFPVNLGSMTVAPGRLSPVVTRHYGRPSSNPVGEVVALITLNPSAYIGGPVKLTSVTITEEDGARMPRLALLDKFGFVITYPARQEGNKVVLRLIEPFEMTSESNELQLAANGARLPSGHVVLSLQGRAFRFTIGDTPMVTEPCSSAGVVELDY